MIRTSLLSLALFVVLGTTSRSAEEPKLGDKEGFRVYSVSPRCQTRQLLGVHETLRGALDAAADLRAKAPGRGIEVTTGTEGKKTPVSFTRPMLYQVHARVCAKSGWKSQAILGDATKAKELAKSLEKNGAKVEIVSDYAPKEVFQVYGRGCSRSNWRLLGTFAEVAEASQAAEENRTRKTGPLNCIVTTGTRSQETLVLEPAQYKIYVQGCKGGWSLRETTTEQKKVKEFVEARKKDDKTRVEVVYHIPSK